MDPERKVEEAHKNAATLIRRRKSEIQTQPAMPLRPGESLRQPRHHPPVPNLVIAIEKTETSEIEQSGRDSSPGPRGNETESTRRVLTGIQAHFIIVMSEAALDAFDAFLHASGDHVDDTRGA